jgi:voltage-gated potassium channel
MTTVLPAAADTRTELSARIARALEWPMALMALAVIPALLLDDGASTPRVHAIAVAVNWAVWLAFCAEFLLRLAVAPSRRTFLRSEWPGLLLIVVSPPFAVPEAFQGLRALRAVRLLRLLRLVRAAAFLGIGLRSTRRPERGVDRI